MILFGKRKKEKEIDPFIIKNGGFKYGKLEKYSHLREWIESSFSSGSGDGEVVGRSFSFFKLRIFGVILFVAIGILIGRVSYLQIIKGDYYRKIADGNSIRIKRIEAKRGVIYDRNKRSLVMNVANFMLYFVPADLPKEEDEKEKLFQKVANVLFPEEEEGRDELIWKIKDGLQEVRPGSVDSYQPFFVIDNIPYERALYFYLNSENMPGFTLSNSDRRKYLSDGVLSLSHILGYTGKISSEELKVVGEKYSQIDYIGKTGVEYFWEEDLRGKNGKKKVEVDAFGYEKKIISQDEIENGNSLVLSLDYDLQKKIEEVIVNNLKKAKLNKASVIAIDPNNGEVLSLVNIPSFDNNVFARGITQNEYSALISEENNPLFNRAISGEYPSGSVIKPVIAAGALEDGVISENTSFFSVGGIWIDKWFFPDWRTGGHGIINVRKAIADSVNTFFYYIGGGYKDFSGLGVDKIAKYFRIFGLGSFSGIDLIGETSGFVPTPAWKKEVKNEKWYIGDTYHMSIGQGDVLVTPLQVANYTAVFANGGKLYRPHLMKEILSENNQLIKTTEDALVRENFINSYNIEIVRSGMRQGVISGSSRRLSDLPVAVAGKTGTAQWSTKKNTHAWWTGFAPYKDPKIVLTIMVEEGGEGSDIGVTIAREILAYYFSQNKNK